MNQIQNPEKLGNVDLAQQWDDVVKKGTKRQRRILRFFKLYFIERGVAPSEVDAALLSNILAALPEDAAKAYFRQPDMIARYAANALIHALADIRKRTGMDLPLLDAIPSVDAQAEADRAAFEKRFAVELAALFKTYRLPAIHATEAMLEKIAQKGRVPISEENRNGIINGLVNAKNYLAADGVTIDRLTDLYGETAMAIITPAAKADSTGRSIQALRSLSQLAQFHHDYGAANELNALAAQIAHDHDLGVISAAVVRSFQSYRDIGKFQEFGATLVQNAQFAEPDDLKKLTVLVRVSSALGALVAVSAPASFEIITHCTFSGEPTWSRRPMLFSKKYGSLENQLTPPLRDLIGSFYLGFERAYGFPPKSLTPGKDGQLAKGAVSAVTRLLARIEAPFTARSLRDLGVYRVAWAAEETNGEDLIEDIAKATRLSPDYVRHYFKPMLDAIAEAKGGRRG
ncbi:hypothetical protein QM467_15885 [Rhodoblastus sp. 17X3]|uniref:hypothetical protein n=1 Tax=Rhodoblastus sp. 17X3 TaxID=3047026 RepID=UPI0024B76F2F|nr:hypothetical protein [Rhodoblastus sp. 17X3]MDI9849536.1 hypothetical protein [Rhodoblastus sp. 17X3]